MNRIRYILLLVAMSFVLSGCALLQPLSTLFYREKPFASLELSPQQKTYEIEFTPKMHDIYEFQLHPNDSSTLDLKEAVYKNLVLLKTRVRFWHGSQYLGEVVATSDSTNQFNRSWSKQGNYLSLFDFGTVKTDGPLLNAHWVNIEILPWKEPFLKVGTTYRVLITIDGLGEFLKTFGPTQLILRPEDYSGNCM